ncbi:hypothetical protein [Paenibacillus arenilitoris]|uniref:Uncharacterized protein n=1 Tax=Paenibacillus arenilitoris TaxID=2772299 RepID=A0A927CSX4_9BACL|nr:hypothetical protein [Paenibacillus arenilitoris]MBD2871286.1 hypothetical protein [Paenibacillus arenilitoris]
MTAEIEEKPLFLLSNELCKRFNKLLPLLYDENTIRNAYIITLAVKKRKKTAENAISKHFPMLVAQTFAHACPEA